MNVAWGWLYTGGTVALCWFVTLVCLCSTGLGCWLGSFG